MSVGHILVAASLASDLSRFMRSENAKVALTILVVAVLTFLLGFAIRDVLARVAIRLRRAPTATSAAEGDS